MMRYKQHLQMLFLLCKVYRIVAEVTSDIFGRFGKSQYTHYKPIFTACPKVNGFHEPDTWSRSFKVMYDKKEHKRNLRSLSYSLRVMLDLDKFHACIEICQISRTKWTPVHEQNKVAKQRRTERAVLRMGVQWAVTKLVRRRNHCT